AYPARPHIQVLRDVTMYLPAHETISIVGSSGSGKFTLGAILMGVYSPTSGCVLLDEQDVRYIDSPYMSCNIAGVAYGAASASDATRGEVEEACRVAMLESWVTGLDQGYETLLSSIGAADIQLTTSLCKS
ncbi:P-loop containing nucleoside triphosphate hydrolase protein, partial [Suillus cothurnatus]